MGLAKRIIPCLDVDAGRVVKGVNFVDIRDAGDPVEVAQRYNQEGADEITFLDITATHEGRDTTVHTVERMASEVFIPLTVGGGIRKVEDIRLMLNAGADKVGINSAAIHNPDFVREAAERFGSQCIVVAIDAKRVADGDGGHWEIFTHGGRNATGIEAIGWARRMAEYGAGEILLTSMDRVWHRGRLRPCPDPGHKRCGINTGDSVRRRRDTGSPGRRYYPGRGGCRAGSQYFSLC